MFSVQRLNTITPSWLAGSNTYTVADGIKGLYQCWTSEIDGTSMETITIPLFENASIGTAGIALKALYDTLWTKDMTWSWVRFSGLSLNSQTSVSTQLLIKKTYCGYEVQPCVASAWSGMMKLGPKPDISTMQAMMDGFYELKDVMPARYNFWGAISSLASSGVKGPGSSVLSALAEKLLGGQKSGKSKKGFVQSILSGMLPSSSPSASNIKPNKSANKGRPQWANSDAKPRRELEDIERQVHSMSGKINQLALGGVGRRFNRSNRPSRSVKQQAPQKFRTGRPPWANK
jgi:hypothetical protein